MILGKMLANARKNKGYTLKEASEKIGCSLIFLHRAETGRHANMTYEIMERMAGVYGLDPDKLAAAKGLVPFDVHLKLMNNPELMALIRQYDVGGM